MVPAAIVKQSEIDARVRKVAGALEPDVRHTRYEIGEDWSGQWAIFFRIVLSDEATKLRLREVATDARRLSRIFVGLRQPPNAIVLTWSDLVFSLLIASSREASQLENW
jgi:hypothetical protein